MARKSAGPKKLQDVRVNPAIASAFAGAKLAPPPAAASPTKLAPPPATSPAKPAAAPAPVALAPPPAAPAAQPAPPSPPAARSSGAGSPWSAASPTSPPHGSEFDPFGSAPGEGECTEGHLLSTEAAVPPRLPNRHVWSAAAHPAPLLPPHPLPQAPLPPSPSQPSPSQAAALLA